MSEEHPDITKSKDPNKAPDQIDIGEFLSSLSDTLTELSDAIDSESSDGIMNALDDMLRDVNNMSTSEPPAFTGDEEPSSFPEPQFTPVDKNAIKNDINDLKVQLRDLKQQIDQGKQNLQQLQNMGDTFVPEFTDYINTLNDYATEIARTSSGGGGRFNTEDLAHVNLAYEYIMAMKDLLIAILKEIINHFGELSMYEMICVALVPIAACASLLANVMNMSAKTIGNAFKLTIVGAFISTGLDDAVEKFIKIAAKILEIIGCIAGICKFIIGQIDGEMGEFFSVISRIFAYVFWAIDCITHATGVMAVEKVPKLPKPISGWDIVDPYEWFAGQIEASISPFIPPIVVGMTSPSPIVQGTNKTPMVKQYKPAEEYEIPKMEFDGGGSVFD